MPDLSVVLTVLVTALALAAGSALVLADRAIAGAAHAVRAPWGETAEMLRAVRSAARRGGISVLVALAVLVGATWVCNSLLRDAAGDAVFATPLAAGIAGVGLYGALQSRRLPARPASGASLHARRVTGFARPRSFVAIGLAVALLLTLEVFAGVATPDAAFSGAGAVVLVGCIAVLIATIVVALRQVAVRAALPVELTDVDLAIRRIATRFILLLSTSAVLAPAGLIALQSGGWIWNNAGVLATDARTWASIGVAVTVVGALAVIGSIATVVAAALGIAKHSRSASSVAARPAGARA